MTKKANFIDNTKKTYQFLVKKIEVLKDSDNEDDMRLYTQLLALAFAIDNMLWYIHESKDFDKVIDKMKDIIDIYNGVDSENNYVDMAEALDNYTLACIIQFIEAVVADYQATKKEAKLD